MSLYLERRVLFSSGGVCRPSLRCTSPSGTCHSDPPDRYHEHPSRAGLPYFLVRLVLRQNWHVWSANPRPKDRTSFHPPYRSPRRLLRSRAPGVPSPYPGRHDPREPKPHQSPLGTGQGTSAHDVRVTWGPDRWSRKEKRRYPRSSVKGRRTYDRRATGDEWTSAYPVAYPAL